MREQDYSKQDWKLFRDRLPGWQEAYMCKLIQEYIALLSEDDSASKKFWKLAERIREDERHPGVQLRLSRSDMIFDILRLIQGGVISLEDLEGFSEDVRGRIELFLKNNGQA